MANLINYAFYFLKKEMYLSSLMIAQYLPESTEMFYIIIKALNELKFYKKIKSIIDKNQNLLKIREIKLLYLKSGFDTDVEPVDTMSLESVSQGTITTDEIISLKSFELMYKALNKKENLRKKLLIDSIMIESNNIEAIIYLYKESLCNRNEIFHYVNLIKDEGLKTAFLNILNGEYKNEIYCPLLFYSFSQLIGQKISIDDLYRCAILNFELFGGCEFVHYCLGLFYLKKEKYADSLRNLYKSFEICKEFGPAYLYAGVSHSCLKETESAVRILNVAYSIMSSSILPAYYLAYEYQTMNNIRKAKYYYKISLEMIESFARNEYSEPGYLIKYSPNILKGHNYGINVDGQSSFIISSLKDNNLIANTSITDNFSFISDNVKRHRLIDDKPLLLDKNSDIYFIICSYIYCLIYYENYNEALSFIDHYGIHNPLKVFCLLFNGLVEDSKSNLESCQKNKLYYALKGFLCHLMDDFEGCILEYEKSLALSRNQVVESLFFMALDNLSAVRSNKAFDYSNCLFETMEYKNRKIFF